MVVSYASTGVKDVDHASDDTNRSTATARGVGDTGEAAAVRQMLGHTNLPEFVGDINVAAYRPESG